MPAIASDRLVDLHNDLTHYDTTVSREIREFLRGNPVTRQRLVMDLELEEACALSRRKARLRSSAGAIMLRYKRRHRRRGQELARLLEERAAGPLLRPAG